MTSAPLVARGALAGLAAELAALIVLAGLWVAVLGDAGDGWDTGGFRVAVTVAAAAIAFAAGAVGGAAGVAAGRSSRAAAREDALVAGAAGPVVAGVLLPLVAAVGGASVLACLLMALVLSGGAALGAIVAVRRGADR